MKDTNDRFTFRDLLAVPFWSIAQYFDLLALSIGGKWTARLYLEEIKNNMNTNEEGIREEWHRFADTLSGLDAMYEIKVADFWLPKLSEERQRVEMIIRGKMLDYRSESQENLDKDNIMLAYDMDSRYVALKHLLENPLLNQNKENI